MKMQRAKPSTAEFAMWRDTALEGVIPSVGSLEGGDTSGLEREISLSSLRGWHVLAELLGPQSLFSELRFGVCTVLPPHSD